MSGDSLPNLERENYTYLVSDIGIKLRSSYQYNLCKSISVTSFLNILPIKNIGERRSKKIIW